MITTEQRQEIARQIGTNLLAISGGRVVGIADGIELPCGCGYSVRVQLTPMDDYTVSRVFRRGGREWIKGQREQVYFVEVGQIAYYASCFRSYDANVWPTK